MPCDKLTCDLSTQPSEDLKLSTSQDPRNRLGLGVFELHTLSTIVCRTLCRTGHGSVTFLPCLGFPPGDTTPHFTTAYQPPSYFAYNSFIGRGLSLRWPGTSVDLARDPRKAR